MEDLSCTCTSDGSAVVLALEGEVDLSTADLLDTWLTAASASGLALVVDLSRVGFLDSSGCNALVRARAAGPLLVRGAQRPVARCLEIAGLADLMCERAPVPLEA
jgi:anti-sigma B factor antagonist